MQHGTLEQRILEAYADGSPIALIANSFEMTEDNVICILRDFKERHRKTKGFADVFRVLMAERDKSGITRTSIAKELGVNAGTVKKACEHFGQAKKDRAISDNEFTRIDGVFDKKSCPSCGSNRVNEVEYNAIYCKKCGNEFFKSEDGSVYRINWEYLEE